MKDKWNEMSYNKFPSFHLSFQRNTYEQWCDHIDDIEDVVAELEEREDSAWVRKANSCIFIGHSLLL